MTFKLQVGRRYRRRDGRITGKLVLNDPSRPLAHIYPFFDPKEKLSYTPTGEFCICWDQSPDDLVKAVVPKAKEISPSPSSIKRVLEDTEAELRKAITSYPSFHTAHEGYAILLEEVDELWAEVKKKQGSEARPERIRKEAVQVAAMALRLILDTTDPTKPAYNK